MVIAATLGGGQINNFQESQALKGARQHGACNRRGTHCDQRLAAGGNLIGSLSVDF
jgi:hypothetical protein